MEEGVRPARWIVAVASGKGGVGKTTITLGLALAFAERGRAVGILDADLSGPDIPALLGLTRTEDAERWTIWRRGGPRLQPIERRGVKVMSAGFLLGERQVMPWQSQTLPFVLRQLLHDVHWGELDYLLIDLPPGSADLQAEVFRASGLDGALLVVGPYDLAHLDAKKVVALLRGANVPILGAVENMASLRCPHCGEQIDVFPAAMEARSLWKEGVPRLARIPFDPAFARPNGAPPPVLVDLAEKVERALA